MLTLPQVAARLGCSDVWVRKLVYRGALAAVRVGPLWLVDLEEVARFQAGHAPTRGRPMGSKNRAPATVS